MGEEGEILKVKYIILFLFLIFSTNKLKAESDSILDETFFIEEYKYSDESTLKEEIRVEQSLMVMSVDPIKMVDTYSKRIITLMYDTLFVVNGNGEIDSHLLDNYRWIEENKLYLELKKGIKFHDNSYLKAQDVEKALERLKKDGIITKIYNSIIGVEVIDDHSLIINLNARDGMLIKNLSNPIASIVKEENGKLYGTGPYYMKSFNEGALKLELFENSSVDKKQCFKNITFTWELNPNQRVIKYLNGETDYIFDLYKEEIDKIREYNLLSEENIVKEEAIYDTIALTFGSKINYSLEEKRAIKEAIVQEVDSFFPQKIIKANLSKIKNIYNLKEAKEKIDESGMKDREISIMILNTEYNMRVAKKVKKDLEDAGLKVTLLPHNMVSFYQKLYSKDYDTAIYNLTISKNSPAVSLEKIIMYDIVDEETISALLPFLTLMRQEKDTRNIEKIFDRILSLIDKSVLYIPIKHELNYSIVKEEDMERYNKSLKIN